MSLLLRQGRVVTGGAVAPVSADVRLADGVIVEIGPDLASAGAAEIDIGGKLLAPGFVDLHLHGAGGIVCEAADPEGLDVLCQMLPNYGVTGFLPTLAALPTAALRTAVTAIVAGRDRRRLGGAPGARILGIHLEGPYLNPDMPGAQRRDWMRAPSLDELDELQEIADGAIRLITLAPELDGAGSFIAAARRRGIAVSIGHTTATAEQTRQAIAAGASHVTHLFNAMRPQHHREPGVVGVALTDDTVSVELICDGEHVHPTSIDLAWRCKPSDKRVLVSDAVALGLPDGTHEIFGARCTIAGGTIRLADNGTLAGSCLSLDRAVRNLRGWLPNVPLPTLLASVTANPAAVIDAPVGRIAVGAPADLVILDDALRVVTTICGGTQVFPSAEPRLGEAELGEAQLGEAKLG